MIIFAVFK